VDLEVVFLHDQLRPDAVHELGLRDGAVARLDEHHEHVERAPAQLDRALAREQAPLRRYEGIALEAVFGGRVPAHGGLCIHGCSLATARASVNSA
jgi:hypothetical protein